MYPNYSIFLNIFSLYWGFFLCFKEVFFSGVVNSRKAIFKVSLFFQDSIFFLIHCADPLPSSHQIINTICGSGVQDFFFLSVKKRDGAKEENKDKMTSRKRSEIKVSFEIAFSKKWIVSGKK